MSDHTKTLLLLLAALACGCSRQGQPAGPAAPTGRQSHSPAYEAELPPDIRELVGRPFTGDLDQMVRRRIIRVGVPSNRTFFFIDDGVQRGIAYEYARLLEDELNTSLKTGDRRVDVVLMPMARGAFARMLQAGEIDMAVTQLTVTPERQALVDFSIPTRTDVNEVLVTGPGAPQVASLEDLGRSTVYVRPSSSYFASLQAHNRQQKAQGKPGIDIGAAPEDLEDDDILEMVNAGLVPATVVDNFTADFWKQVFPNLVVHDDLTLRTGGELAVAFRKGSPQLAAMINSFIARHGLSSAIGRVLNERYLQNTTYVKDAAQGADLQHFIRMESIFRRYGDEYRFDYLLMAAQGFQESHLDQNARSRAGAIGVMQLMPRTGEAEHVGDIRQADPNIHAGVKYMRFMRDEYFEGQPMSPLNKELFTFAAYDAGVGRIEQLRRVAAARGLDPNVWFDNVEQVVSERIGRETVSYVSNIYKYYLAYRLITQQTQARRQARQAFRAQTAKSGEART
jgi:membrane-bound lytic murein transglycosylase MltF